jgi:hypothetical protein
MDLRVDYNLVFTERVWMYHIVGVAQLGCGGGSNICLTDRQKSCRELMFSADGLVPPVQARSPAG